MSRFRSSRPTRPPASAWTTRHRSPRTYNERDNAFTGKILKVTVDVKPVGAAVKAQAEIGERAAAVKAALSN